MREMAFFETRRLEVFRITQFCAAHPQHHVLHLIQWVKIVGECVAAGTVGQLGRVNAGPRGVPAAGVSAGNVESPERRREDSMIAGSDQPRRVLAR